MGSRKVRPHLDSPLAVLFRGQSRLRLGLACSRLFLSVLWFPSTCSSFGAWLCEEPHSPWLGPPRPRAALDEVMCHVNTRAPYPPYTQCFTKSAGTEAPSEVPVKKSTSVPAASFYMNSLHEQWCVNHHLAVTGETDLVTLSPPENPWNPWGKTGDHTQGKPGFLSPGAEFAAGTGVLSCQANMPLGGPVQLPKAGSFCPCFCSTRIVIKAHAL